MNMSIDELFELLRAHECRHGHPCCIHGIEQDLQELQQGEQGIQGHLDALQAQVAELLRRVPPLPQDVPARVVVTIPGKEAAMANPQEPINTPVPIHAEVQNAEGVALPGYSFTFTADLVTPTAVDGQNATVTATAIETATITASTTFPDGSTHTGSLAVDFVDDTPAQVVVTLGK